MNELQNVFDYNGNKIRTVRVNEEPWFVAKDVCEVLGISTKAVTMHVRKLPEEMRSLNRIEVSNNRTLEVNCINEPGVYRLIMRSDKPEALSFQNWIAQEVLPSIRKHGIYMTPSVAQEAISDKTAFLAKALLVAQEVIDTQKAQIEVQAATIETLKPAADAYSEFMDAKGTMSMTDVSKVLGLAVEVLVAHLITNKILRRNVKKEFMPTKAYENSGYFRVNVTPAYIHTRVTHKGFDWLSGFVKATLKEAK